ncbi:hypothetical protein GCM10027174_44650 [Salinifilum aidingensis]
MTDRDPHTLGWAAYGMARWLDDRDQNHPLRREELFTTHEKTEAVRKLVQRLTDAGVLTVERGQSAFGEGSPRLYRTH